VGFSEANAAIKAATTVSVIAVASPNAICQLNASPTSVPSWTRATVPRETPEKFSEADFLARLLDVDGTRATFQSSRIRLL